MKHTAKPWYTTGGLVYHQENPGGRKLVICDAYRDMGAETAIANARLIAAAPELLARLELAVRYLEHPDVQAIPFAASAAGCAELCRAAIARAKS